MLEELEIVRDEASWDAFLESSHAHILQTWAWGELKRRFGWRAERVAWREDGRIAAGAQILYRSLAPALTIAYVPRGPVCAEQDAVAPFLDKLQAHVRARNVFLLKLEPDWVRGDAREGALRRAHPTPAHPTPAHPTPTPLQRTGATPSVETIQPPATIHLDLTANLETILARMKPKWRYNIRLAEKKGVVVRQGDASDFAAFYELMRITGERDHFAIHGTSYYQTAFELFKIQDHVRLLIAEYEQKPLGMIFVTGFADEAIYLYGASGNAERNRMPNHALHWAAIQWAKARGCARYDLWGVPETIDETAEDANLPPSLYQFKQGFGGTVVRYTGAWDFVFNPALHRVYQIARKVRKSRLG